MDQTPAPSRRFLHSSNAPNQKTFPRAASKKSAPIFSQLPPSSSSGSSFSRPSRFQYPGRSQTAEIATSVNDGGKGTEYSKLQVFRPFGVSGVDSIDEEDIDLEGAPCTNQMQHRIRSDSDSDSELDADKGFEDVQALHGDVAMPLPKRRRIMGKRVASDEPMILSSSPAGQEALDIDVEEMTDEYSDLDEEEKFAAKPIRTPGTASRFKPRTLAAPMMSNAEQKPVFRPPDPANHLATEITNVLPEAFTPSRKKGKRGYVAGGLADTTRNMVLSIAAEAGQTGVLHEKLVSIKSATLDSSGRAILAVAADNTQWVLPGEQDGGKSETLTERLDKIHQSGQVMLFGNASQWLLPLTSAQGRGEMRFSAHWAVSGEQ